MEAQPLSHFALLSALGVSGLGRDVVQVLMTVCLIIPSLSPLFEAEGRTEGLDVILCLLCLRPGA